MSRFSYLVLVCVAGAACAKGVTPPSPPAPPPSPPPPPPNHAPVAVAGGPYNSTTGVIKVDGSQSSDPDGDPITFKWDFGDGTSGDSAKMSHTYLTSGNFNISLAVTDNKAAKGTAATTAGIVLETTYILAGAGNIASGSHIAAQTAALLDQIDGTVFTTGDNAFPDGTDSAYAKYYASTWGRHLGRTRPVLGNHDYMDVDAHGSFDYFGDRLGTRGLGYYSYDLGNWHIIVLNDKGAAGIDPTQTQWLLDDLDAHKSQRCTIAMWHVPRFLSSNTPGWTENRDHQRMWDILYAAGVDIVLNGQQHNYERFEPMTPNGDVDTAAGIREFNVGTGGESVDNFTVIHPHSAVRAGVFGILKLTLKTDSYTWEFVPVPGVSFTDTGSGSCH